MHFDGETEASYVIAAGDAFPITENLMKPYPFRGLSKKQRIYYNYHFIAEQGALSKTYLGY